MAGKCQGDLSPLRIPSPVIINSSEYTGVDGAAGVCLWVLRVWELKAPSLHLSSGKPERIHCACTGLMQLGLLVTVPTVSRQDTLLNPWVIPRAEPGALPASLMPDLLPHRAETPWGCIRPLQRSHPAPPPSSSPTEQLTGHSPAAQRALITRQRNTTCEQLVT